MATPLMNLDLPVVGVLGTDGPDWADKLNTALEVIDEHDHSSGKGTRVKSAGISIDADLTFGGYKAIGLKSSRYESQGSVFATSPDNNSVYVVSGELYFKDSSGNNVQLTSGGAINISSIGAITGDYSTSSADLNYSDSTKTFLFLQSAGVTANVAHGPLLIYKNSASSNYSKFSIPAAQSSNLDFEWVSAYPAAKYPMFMSTGGAVTSEAAAIIDAHVSASAALAQTKLNLFGSSDEINNLTLSVTANSGSSHALVISVKTKAGTDASSTDPVSVGTRSSTLSSGVFNRRQITGGLSMTVSNGSTLGHSSATDHYIYVYLIDNAGTLELAVSSKRFEDNSIISTTSEGGAGAADSLTTIYSTTARSNVPIRLIGRMLSNQTSAGVWDSVPTEIKLTPFDLFEIQGVTNGSSANSGYVGEYLESIPGLVSTSATNVWADVASLSLTPGDWDVTGTFHFENSGATLTRLFCGISPNSGNTAAGLTLGVNYFEPSHPASGRDSGFAIPNYRVSITTTTTYYLKVQGVYTVSDIDVRSRISARRVR